MDLGPIRPVVIIGAGRSGTNILRDVMAADPDATTWPCDEINYIWRHGNRSHPTDEFEPWMASEHVRRFVRRAFAREARRGRARIVVEKTCANSLRVEFVARILPEARFVWIRRDPVAVVASAMKRWQAELDLRYVARKARFVPPTDLPFYATRYLTHRLAKISSRSDSLPTWGPRFEAMDRSVRDDPLHVVCARQWRRCEDRAAEAFKRLGPDNHVAVRYADLVVKPGPELRRITEFAYGAPSAAAQAAAERLIRDPSAERSAHGLTSSQVTDIVAIADSGRS